MNNRRACAIGRRRLEDADVEPEGLACLVPRAHLEVLHPLALLDEAHHVTALIAETVAVDVGAGQHIAARAPEHFLGAPPQDALRGPIPERDAAVRPYRKGTVAGAGQCLAQDLVC